MLLMQVYTDCSASDAPNCIHLINQNLSQIYLLAFASGVSINPNKAMALLIEAPENFISYLPPIQINGSNIGFVRTGKSFGVTLNRELNWSDHIKMNCGKTFAMLRNLWISQY